MRCLDLDRGWRFRRDGDPVWRPAIVPGSFLADLERTGLLPDPYFRDNEVLAKEACESGCEYACEFDLEGPDVSAGAPADLVCLGLDTLCTIFLNGSRVGSADNMHRTWRFPVASLLRPGRNALRLRFESALAFVRQRRQGSDIRYVPTGCVAGNQYLRKAHCAFGWDWGPQLPDMGIFRSIRLEFPDRARILDLRVSQRHGENRVDLAMHMEAILADGSVPGESPVLQAAVDLLAPDGRRFLAEGPLVGGRCVLPLSIESPELWWPNNLGGQPLYRLRAVLRLPDGEGDPASTEAATEAETAAATGRELDARELRIGLRELGLRREPDAWGESFSFQVNGVPFFAMGADYVPEDAIPGRRTTERTRRLVRDCARANFNCLRVWGGGAYPDDDFYDLCDEAGLVVWQDFLFACNVYDLTEDFAESIRAETEDNIRRLRHHACLGLWCGNNELEWHWVELPAMSGHPERYRRMYLEQFEGLLAEVAARLDPERDYWPASPSSGGGFDAPNDEGRGDMHIWDVWHGLRPFGEYRKMHPRFCSEFGFESYPSMKTLEQVTEPGDRNPFSDILEVHQKRPGGNARIAWYLAESLLYPLSLAQMVQASQVLQAEALRCGVEHWRRNRGRCMGAVYWQLNDNWPVASWSSLDYDGRWKAAHYLARRFFAPVSASAVGIPGRSVLHDDTRLERDLPETGAEIHAANERRTPLDARLRWTLQDAAGQVLEEGGTALALGPMDARRAVSLDWSGGFPGGRDPREVFLAFSLQDDREILAEGTMLFVRPRRFRFRDPEAAVAVREDGRYFYVDVTVRAPAFWVFLETEGFDCVFSDNWFDLQPGPPKRVTVEKGDPGLPAAAEAFAASLSVRSVFDIGRLPGDAP